MLRLSQASHGTWHHSVVNPLALFQTITVAGKKMLRHLMWLIVFGRTIWTKWTKRFGHCGGIKFITKFFGIFFFINIFCCCTDFKNWLRTVDHCQLKTVAANWTQIEQINQHHSHIAVRNSHANQAWSLNILKSKPKHQKSNKTLLNTCKHTHKQSKSPNFSPKITGCWFSKIISRLKKKIPFRCEQTFGERFSTEND